MKINPIEKKPNKREISLIGGKNDLHHFFFISFEKKIG